MKWTDPFTITTPGWYFVRDNSGDRWIAYCNTEDVHFDTLFGRSEDDGIEVAGPIKWPEEEGMI